MSENNPNQTYPYQIVSPPLTESNYGQNIADVFNNINENFKWIVESQFLKGEAGDDIQIEEIDLSLQSGTIYNDIFQVISQDCNDVETSSVISGDKVVNWYDSFKQSPFNSIKMIKSGDEYVSCLPYIFTDARFKTLIPESTDPGANPEERYNYINYDQLTDLSCTISYQNGQFVKIQNLPTLYFDTEISEFCWKINNEKTGLYARGPRGDIGLNGGVLLVQLLNENIIDEFGKKWNPIASIYYNGDWCKLSEIDGSKIKLREGDVVISNTNIEGVNKIIISPIKLMPSEENYADGEVWVASPDFGTDVGAILNVTDLVTVLNNLPAEKCLGLFLPFIKRAKGDTSSHILKATEKDGDEILVMGPYSDIEEGATPIVDVSTKMSIEYPTVDILSHLNVGESANIGKKIELDGVKGEMSISGSLSVPEIKTDKIFPKTGASVSIDKLEVGDINLNNTLSRKRIDIINWIDFASVLNGDTISLNESSYIKNTNNAKRYNLPKAPYDGYSLLLRGQKLNLLGAGSKFLTYLPDKETPVVVPILICNRRSQLSETKLTYFNDYEGRGSVWVVEIFDNDSIHVDSTGTSTIYIYSPKHISVSGSSYTLTPEYKTIYFRPTATDPIITLPSSIQHRDGDRYEIIIIGLSGRFKFNQTVYLAESDAFQSEVWDDKTQHGILSYHDIPISNDKKSTHWMWEDIASSGEYA